MRKEAAPAFTIEGDGVQLKPEKFFGISGKKKFNRKTIVLARVLEGQIAEGQMIKISHPGGKIFIACKVLRIEINYRRVDYAAKNESVGICLGGISLRQLRKFNQDISLAQPETCQIDESQADGTAYN